MTYVDKAFRFNPASPDFQDNLYSIYHQMRTHQPILRIGRTWVLTRHQDIYQVLKNRHFMSSGIPDHLHSEMARQSLTLSPGLRALLYGIVLFEDGERHRHHRQALQALFMGDAWSQLSDIVLQEAAALVEPLARSHCVEGITGIAAPLWGRLFTRWLNLPDEQQAVVEQEKSAIRLLLDPSSIDKAGLERLLLALANLDQSFSRLARAHAAGYDSLFYRSLAKGYGEDKESLFTRFPTDCITMLIGGSETSEALTGNLLLMLAQHPELQAGVRNNTLRLKDIVTETMRVESPLQMARRKVCSPATLCGRELKTGDNILLCLGSANRDESVFEDASRFIPARKNAQRQLGFGGGMHQCIGQLLAQFQAENLAQAVCAKGTISLTAEAEWSSRSLILRSLASLPLVLHA